jgi:hypothetical protein
VWQLPVTTELARAGGVDLYGYPKFLADIRFGKGPDQVTCSVTDETGPIVSMRGNVLPVSRGQVSRNRSYSILDDIPLVTTVMIDQVETGESREKGPRNWISAQTIRSLKPCSGSGSVTARYPTSTLHLPRRFCSADVTSRIAEPFKMMKKTRLTRSLIMAAVMFAATNVGSSEVANSDSHWISLFNGSNLHGWQPKIRGLDAGQDPAGTFSVKDGYLTVSYDGYAEFDDRFGHLFFHQPFSHYRLRLEYRFIGKQQTGAPQWALRNSGVMLHSQAPASMPREQDFPISIEFQFLGGLGDGEPRPTGNLCTPGTDALQDGKLIQTHCLDSASPTLDGDQLVKAEVLVRGERRLVHYINGQPVLEYGATTTGGGAVSGYRPGLKPEGKALSSGYIALQSEGHPVQFRTIELLDLQRTACPEID